MLATNRSDMKRESTSFSIVYVSNIVLANTTNTNQEILQKERLPAEANSAGSTSAPVEETPLSNFS